MELKKLSTRAELEKAFLVLHELRPHLDFPAFLAMYDWASKADHYTVIGAFQGADCVAFMGYRVLFDCVHGKHLYIDDLAVKTAMQSKGIGKELLQFAEHAALETGCKLLRLSTGSENFRARSFYEREGWAFRSVTYKKPTPDSSVQV